MSRNIMVAGIMIFASVMAFLAILLGGGNAYDIQGLAIGFARLTALVLWVVFARKLIAAIEGDDLDEDWARINDGNMAVAVYRFGEYASLVTAGAVLLAKV